MTRTRRIWEDACLDIELSEVSPAAERLFWRMLSKTDDYGNLPASPKWIHGACVPLCGTTPRSVERRRDELAAAGLITLYDASERNYLHFPAFPRRQPFRGDYIKRRLYPGEHGEEPDNPTSPSWRKASPKQADKRKETVRGPGEDATDSHEVVRERAEPERNRAQKEKEKEKEKLPENLNEKKKEKENGTPSSPSDNFDLENSPSHSPPSSPARMRLVVSHIVACYRRCHPGAYVGEEKLRGWIEADLGTLTSKEICEALENSPPALYYHDALRALRERVASAERSARTKAKYEQMTRGCRTKAGQKP